MSGIGQVLSRLDTAITGAAPTVKEAADFLERVGQMIGDFVADVRARQAAADFALGERIVAEEEKDAAVILAAANPVSVAAPPPRVDIVGLAPPGAAEAAAISGMVVAPAVGLATDHTPQVAAVPPPGVAPQPGTDAKASGAAPAGEVPASTAPVIPLGPSA